MDLFEEWACKTSKANPILYHHDGAWPGLPQANYPFFPSSYDCRDIQPILLYNKEAQYQLPDRPKVSAHPLNPNARSHIPIEPTQRLWLSSVSCLLMDLFAWENGTAHGFIDLCINENEQLPAHAQRELAAAAWRLGWNGICVGAVHSAAGGSLTEQHACRIRPADLPAKAPAGAHLQGGERELSIGKEDGSAAAALPPALQRKKRGGRRGGKMQLDLPTPPPLQLTRLTLTTADVAHAEVRGRHVQERAGCISMC
jgi:hypothetical protein